MKGNVILRGTSKKLSVSVTKNDKFFLFKKSFERNHLQDLNEQLIFTFVICFCMSKEAILLQANLMFHVKLKLRFEKCCMLYVVHTHKKGGKQCLKNYRPISFVLICTKTFERIIYNELSIYFTDILIIT